MTDMGHHTTDWFDRNSMEINRDRFFSLLFSMIAQRFPQIRLKKDDI